MIDFVQFKNLAAKTESLPLDTLPPHVAKRYDGQLFGGITSRDDNEWTGKSSGRFMNTVKGSTCFITNRPLKFLKFSGVSSIRTDLASFPYDLVDILYVDEITKECLIATNLANGVIWNGGDSAIASVSDSFEDIEPLMPEYLDYVYILGEGMWQVQHGETFFTDEDCI